MIDSRTQGETQRCATNATDPFEDAEAEERAKVIARSHPSVMAALTFFLA